MLRTAILRISRSKISFLVLTSGKFLEALGRGIGTGSIFCLSFSLSNRVHTMYSGILCIFMFIRRIVYFNLFWSRYQLTISKSTFFFLILWYSERNNNCLNSKQTRDTMSVMKFQEMIMIFWKNIIKCISCLNMSSLHLVKGFFFQVKICSFGLHKITHQMDQYNLCTFRHISKHLEYIYF